MIKFSHISFKALIFGVVLFLSSCDEALPLPLARACVLRRSPLDPDDSGPARVRQGA